MSRADDLAFLKAFCPHGGHCECGERCTSLDYIAAEARKPLARDLYGERIAAHRADILAACQRLGL